MVTEPAKAAEIVDVPVASTSSATLLRVTEPVTELAEVAEVWLLSLSKYGY